MDTSKHTVTLPVKDYNKLVEANDMMTISILSENEREAVKQIIKGEPFFVMRPSESIIYILRCLGYNAYSSTESWPINPEKPTEGYDSEEVLKVEYPS